MVFIGKISYFINDIATNYHFGQNSINLFSFQEIKAKKYPLIANDYQGNLIII